jgi:hypothetical protein
MAIKNKSSLPLKILFVEFLWLSDTLNVSSDIVFESQKLLAVNSSI